MTDWFNISDMEAWMRLIDKQPLAFGMRRLISNLPYNRLVQYIKYGSMDENLIDKQPLALSNPDYKLSKFNRIFPVIAGKCQ